MQGASLNLHIDPAVEKKLREKHGVMPMEVLECFQNRLFGSLIDDRAENQTYPPTQWFIAETNAGRKLKVVYMFDKKLKQFVLKTAYEPNVQEEKIYGAQNPAYRP